jgi:hypothetical protein
MSDNNENKQKEQDLLVADLIIRVSALERVLVNKNILTSDDLVKEIKVISEGVIKFLQNKEQNKEQNKN